MIEITDRKRVEEQLRVREEEYRIAPPQQQDDPAVRRLG
jgi:hypothetical protein